MITKHTDSMFKNGAFSIINLIFKFLFYAFINIRTSFAEHFNRYFLFSKLNQFSFFTFWRNGYFELLQKTFYILDKSLFEHCPKTQF